MTLTTLALAGCAGFSNDGGMDRVSALSKERIGHALPSPGAQQEGKDRLQSLLAAP